MPVFLIIVALIGAVMFPALGAVALAILWLAFAGRRFIAKMELHDAVMSKEIL